MKTLLSSFLLRPPWRHRKRPFSFQPMVEELEQRQLLSTTLPQPLYFDFGTATSPVAQGYVRVSPISYTQGQGFGWTTITGLEARDRGTSDPLTRDFHKARDATFLVDTANGSYDVTITLGDATVLRDQVSVWAEGQQMASGLQSQPGQFVQRTFRVQVNDNQLTLRIADLGGSNQYFTVIALAVIPVGASAGPDKVAGEGEVVTFSGTAGGGPGPHTYLWDFGDGTRATGSLNPTHLYADQGVYTVNLSITDALGTISSDSATVTVGNRAPVVLAGGSALATPGASIDFAAVVTDQGPEDMTAGFTYLWDFGDGGTSTQEAPSHTYTEFGIYTVTVTVTDKDGASSTAVTSAAVRPSPIFLATTGVYALGHAGVNTPDAVLNNPEVDGIALRAVWSAIEIADDVYDWTYLDDQMAAAAAAGKSVSLNIRAGTSTPTWVYDAGAVPFNFIDETKPKTQTIPVPWDPVFLSKWENFVQALGSRYGANPALSHVKITGINTNSGETLLPIHRGERDGDRVWTTTNDVNHWRSLGYTPTRITNTWQAIADMFARAFPTKQIALPVLPRAFPPIDEQGNRVTGSRYDAGLPAALIELGISRYGQQFLVMNAGLSAYSISPLATAVADRITTGHQMAWYVTGDPTYRMNDGVSANERTVLQAAVDRGLAGGAKFLEIYPADLSNPDLQEVIAGTRASLDGTGPTAGITGIPPVGQALEGVAIRLTSTIADPLSTDPAGFTYQWSLSRDGVEIATGSGPDFSFTPDDNESYDVSLVVTDPDGRTSAASTITLAVTNRPPAADAGGPYAGLTGVPLDFAGTAVDGSPVDNASGFLYTWDFGDGETGQGATASHTYQGPGVYGVTLTVTDKDGASRTVAARVTVA